MKIVIAVLIARACCGSPVFYADILPILQKHCQSCHRPGQIAPFPLLTYEQARPWSKSIREAVLTRRMPPWSADSHVGRFANDRSLSPREIETVRRWVEDGSLAGSEKDAPRPVTFTAGWSIQKPDIVIDTGTDYKIPAQGSIEYHYFTVHTGFRTDEWISQIEVQPGNRAAVHHIVVYSRPPGSRFLSRAIPGQIFVPSSTSASSGTQPPQGSTAVVKGISKDPYEQIGVYLPGGDPFRAGPHQGRLVRAQSDLIFEVHYVATGSTSSDRSRVGMVFSTERPAERIVNAAILNSSLYIPAGAPAHPVEALIQIEQETAVRSVTPHMHLRGRSFEVSALYPGGESTPVLSVPRYDFNWQISYEPLSPVHIPKGTILRLFGCFDNSRNNPANPNWNTDVRWGEQTSEEMMQAFVDFVIPAGTNPALLFASSSMLPADDDVRSRLWSLFEMLRGK